MARPRHDPDCIPRGVAGLVLAGIVLGWAVAGCVATGPGGGRSPVPRGPFGPSGRDSDLDQPGVTVRLALARQARAVLLEGRSLVLQDGAGAAGVVAGLPGEGRIVVAVAAGRLLLDGRPAGTTRLLVEGEGIVGAAVDGGPTRRHRGRLEAIAGPEGLLLVNELPLERYLAGVVGLEMDPGWPLEALKAQAVASRTYALYQLSARRRAAGGATDYDLETGVLDQVYGGADGERPRAVEAVLATRGEWLAGPDGEPILAVFHSTAGGHTESSADVWGRALPYLVGRSCPYDRGSPVSRWRWTVPIEEVERRLAAAGYPVRGLHGLDVATRTASGRAATMRATGAAGPVDVPAVLLRRLLGYGRLRSTLFRVERDGDAFRFDGRGAGHGVGLCQWGARGMALEGYDYGSILGFYYAGVGLTVRAPSRAPTPLARAVARGR